jgi:hypothetical protein
VSALELLKLGGHTATREVATIGRQSQHLTRLVDDLLDIARVTRGKLELKRRQVELRAIVSHAIEIAPPLIERRRQVLTVEVEPHVLVDGDPFRLAQLLANLLDNAAKYTPDSAHIQITAHARATVQLPIVAQPISRKPPVAQPVARAEPTRSLSILTQPSRAGTRELPSARRVCCEPPRRLPAPAIAAASLYRSLWSGSAAPAADQTTAERCAPSCRRRRTARPRSRALVNKEGGRSPSHIPPQNGIIPRTFAAQSLDSRRAASIFAAPIKSGSVTSFKKVSGAACRR